MLYDAYGRAIVAEKDNNEEIMRQIAEVQLQLQAAKQGVSEGVKLPKNHRPGKATDSVWTRIGEMSMRGKVPQQQKDLAAILTGSMELMVEYKEASIFNIVNEQYTSYRSLVNSVQDPTYLLRYYRGLKKDDRGHAGFVARDFLRVV